MRHQLHLSTRFARIALVGIGLMSSAARADEQPFDLDALLARTGALEAERTGVACRWTERTRIEQLDGNGAVTGSVTRSYAVVAKGSEVVSRTKLDEKIEGDVSWMMRREPAPNQGDRRARLSPFHPEMRPAYDFSVTSRDDRAVVVSLKPKEPDEKRMTGSARLDPLTGRVMHMSIRPSRMPSFLDQLSMEIRLASGPCGNQAQEVVATGTGGMLFMKIRFHSDTTFTDIARGDGAAHP